ncbi:MAG: TIGR03560 family F420-dependent LLM class oxidoreductase [Halobacteria archaeon]|nr:TIGR03560 family F420-dependent LLM class oxidoreductase [Halobacteria archaeon]
MPEIAVMIEGQNGLNWERWKRIGRAVEDFGFDGLFRSDHFTNPDGPYKDSLELWVSLTWLADNTERIEFGSLVTPVSFRNPVFTARMGKDVDNLAGGRFLLGVGAGWQEREHETFGFDLLDIPERFNRFEEGVTVIHRLLRSEEPVSFDGDYYELEGAKLLPRPKRQGGTRILVGGNGRNRTLPLAAEYADEWNGIFLTPSDFEELNDRLDKLLEERGRDPSEVRRSMMTQVVFGRDDDELEDALDGRDPDELRDRGAIVGNGSQVARQIERLGDAGVERVMLQWLDLDDIDRLEALADAVL